MNPKRKDSLTSCSSDWNKVQDASLLDLARILIFYQAKSCVFPVDLMQYSWETANMEPSPAQAKKDVF